MTENGDGGRGWEDNAKPPATGSGEDNGEVFIPAEELRGAADLLIGHMEPEALLRNQPHACGSGGVSFSRDDSEPINRVTLQVAQEIFAEEIPADLHEPCRAALEQLEARRVAATVKTKVHDAALEPMPENFDLRQAARRLEVLRRLLSGGSALKSELERHAEEQVSAACRGMDDRISRHVGPAPRCVGLLITDVMANLVQKTATAFNAGGALQRMERLLKRHKGAIELGSQITPELRHRVQARFLSEERSLIAQAADAVVAQLCDLAVRRVLARFMDRLRVLRAEARGLERRRGLVLDVLSAGRSGPAAAGAEDQGGGRAVTLPGRDPEQLKQRILAKRGCHDLAEVARVYRDELGPALAPRSDEDAYELAPRIRRLVGADCESECVYSLLVEREAAQLIAAELYTRAHPFVSLRLAAEELGVCLARYEHVELPLADDNPAHQEARRVVEIELRRLSGGRIRVIDRPSHVAAIRVMRAVCGYPSVCDQTNAPLRAAYELIQPLLKHDAHPTRSSLVAPKGCLRTKGLDGTAD
jgi:hypothetical protein